jgi:hypothetical protein
MKIVKNLNLNQKFVSIIAIFISITFAFSLIIIKDFSFPLTGWVGVGTDRYLNHDYVDLQEYTGYYLAKNLSFNPFPKLDLFNNQSFYPYGINSVFQPWSIEKDYFYAILYLFFGIGSWLQIYYVLSVAIAAIGTFILLQRDYGLARATGAGFIVSFGNFYAINKYPQHLQYAVIHWVVLSVIADFLIVKRIALRQPLSLRLILLRACLLFLSFGHDFGYIAGLALMSFAVSILFIAGLIGYRYLRGEFKLREGIRRLLETYKNDFFTHPRICLGLISISIIATYLYFPLALQVAKEAKSFDFTTISFDSFWANPLRLLIPFFPFINPTRGDYQRFLSDLPESIGDSSPGWFLVIVGTLGLCQTRKRIIIFIPLLIIFLLCLFYHPVFFPTLKIFPWFAFNRAGGRSTIVYPVILSIFALHTNFSRLRLRKRQLVTGLLVLIASIELCTAYSFKLEYQPASLDQSFFTYMEYVKKQPGEAVLDLPFCIAGSGAGGICPYYLYNSGIFTLRRFHEKKVMGQYFGRLHPSQVKPYLEAGWDKLFFPDSKESRQARCFNEAEWSFFTDFFKLNDFAGINLYVDRFPENCLNEFYDRFGNPAVETVIPDAGKVQFIPKSSELRKQVNLSLGTKVKLETSTEF